MELPQYSVKPNVGSIIISQFFKLVLLCAFFYGGVWVNFYLLSKEFSLMISALLISVLAVLIAIQLLITKSRANKYHYDFFSNRVEFYGDKLKSVLYSDIKETKLKRSVSDLISGTGTIVISKNFSISNIKDYKEIQNYLNQLVQSYSASRTSEIPQQYAAT